MKKFIVLICFTIILGSFFNITNAVSDINVILNGNNLTFSQSPIIQNDRTLVPMRAIFEAMGATIIWDEATQIVSAQKGNVNLKLQIGNNIAFQNGEEKKLDTAPILLNGSTLIPVRFIAECLGASVNWDSNNNSVIIDEQEVAKADTPKVQIEMESGGKIVVELYPQYAPKTVINFLELVGQGFYDGLVFHRIIPGFMVQGGDPSGNGTGGSTKKIEGEFAQNGFTQNTLLHTRGVISMARAQDMNSASSQFFIMHADAPHLDGAYAAFGKVISGIEVVDQIAKEENGKPKIKKISILP